MNSCPHCGYRVQSDAKICPHCGTELLTVWPPPPDGITIPAPPKPPKLLTGMVWMDFLLGAAGQYLTHLATAQALIRFSGLLTPSRDDLSNYFAPGFVDIAEGFWAILFGLGLYYGLRRFYPIMARGSGYASIALFAIILGGLFTCRALPF